MGTPPVGYNTSISIPLPTDEQLVPEVVAKLRQANDLNVARMLAGTTDMLEGATGLVRALCQAKDIDPKIRQLIILRIAYLLDCPFDWQANVVMARNAGCSQEQIEAMTSDGTPATLDRKTTLVMLATDELTKTGTLSDRTLQKLRETYDDVVCRKLVLIIAWFNLLSRFLNGCRVPLKKLGDRTSPLG
jgi:alkylhydroperoxidase family enzyme